jgi:CRP-like cAMP-binding protein
MSSNIAEQLEGSPLFRGVDLADREALVQVMRHQSYTQDQTLFEKDSAGDSVYIILSGRIRIYTQDEQGREFTIRHLEPPNTFGEFSMLDQKPRSAAAAAAEQSEVLILHRDDFLAFLKERPLVGLSMMRNLVERVRYTTMYLQRVMEATQQLTQGNFDQAVEDIPGSETGAEIQSLIETFVDMVRSVQAREQQLKRTQDKSLTDTDQAAG